MAAKRKRMAGGARRKEARRGSRQGRGRLSAIDQLPDEAEEDVIWVLEQLRDRSRSQKDILPDFNARLGAKGIDPISPSSFNRYAVRKALQWRRLDEFQALAGELRQTLTAEGPDEVTVLVAEFVKMAAFELLEGGELKSKEVMELSRALQSAVSAQRGSEEYRKQLERRVAAQLEDAADTVESMGREAGLSPERLAELRRKFLGVGSGK